MSSLFPHRVKIDRAAVLRRNVFDLRTVCINNATAWRGCPAPESPAFKRITICRECFLRIVCVRGRNRTAHYRSACARRFISIINNSICVRRPKCIQSYSARLVEAAQTASVRAVILRSVSVRLRKIAAERIARANGQGYRGHCAVVSYNDGGRTHTAALHIKGYCVRLGNARSRNDDIPRNDATLYGKRACGGIVHIARSRSKRCAADGHFNSRRKRIARLRHKRGGIIGIVRRRTSARKTQRDKRRGNGHCLVILQSFR